MTYIVETLFTYGWENCWTEDDKPMTFDTREEAQAEIDDIIESGLDYNQNDFRIIEVES